MPPKPTETACSFLDSLPRRAMRAWCWLPRQTVTCTLPMPGGEWYVFQVRYCPQQALWAYNVAVYTLPEEQPRGAGPLSQQEPGRGLPDASRRSARRSVQGFCPCTVPQNGV